MAYDGRGMIRGGSTASAPNLDSNLQASSKNISNGNPSVQFDSPVRYVGTNGSALNNKEQETNGSSSGSVAKPKIVLLNKQGQVR